MSNSWDENSQDVFEEGTPEHPAVQNKRKFGLASRVTGKFSAFDDIALKPTASNGRYGRLAGATGSAHASAVRSRLGVQNDMPEEKVSTGDDDSSLIAECIVSEY